MKSKNLIILLVVATLILGCKKESKVKEPAKVGTVGEETVQVEPNMSDIHFENALHAYEANNKQEAAMQISKGLMALERESKNISGTHKANLQGAREQLENIAGKLEDDDAISIDGFKEAIANAEINVSHSYLIANEVFVLEKPEDVATAKSKSRFNTVLSNLKKDEGKFDKDAKKDGEALLTEGKKLDAEVEEWAKKAEDYTKRVNEHFKKHHPEYYNNWDLIN